ncbi:MAG TPA: proprotein convertase P-domain-containing protein, partial [Tahibacter sp.]|nr:proprotein convertase P-domain-containing protein [Tahibacter sp.]
RCTANSAQGNGIAEPGERVMLTVPVQAHGDAFGDVRAQLVPPFPAGVRVLRGSDALGDLALGATAEAQLEIELAPDAACLSTSPLNLRLSGGAQAYAVAVPLAIGQERPLPAGLPRAIPDGDAAGASSTLDIAAALTAQSLAVRVAIEHAWVGDLRVTLTGPNGTTVTLLDRPGVPASAFGCGNRDVVVRFADGAANAESLCGSGVNAAWPVGDAAPVQALAAFAGQSLQGRWTLTATDAAGGYRGRIANWSLDPQPGFATQCAVCGDVPEAIFADGFETP